MFYFSDEPLVTLWSFGRTLQPFGFAPSLVQFSLSSSFLFVISFFSSRSGKLIGEKWKIGWGGANTHWRENEHFHSQRGGGEGDQDHDQPAPLHPTLVLSRRKERERNGRNNQLKGPEKMRKMQTKNPKFVLQQKGGQSLWKPNV